MTLSTLDVATAVHTVTGVGVQTALVMLGVFAGAYALYGGLKAVALTDIVQVSLLVPGGLLFSYIALTRIGDGNLLSGRRVSLVGGSTSGSALC